MFFVCPGYKYRQRFKLQCNIISAAKAQALLKETFLIKLMCKPIFIYFLFYLLSRGTHDLLTLDLICWPYVTSVPTSTLLNKCPQGKLCQSVSQQV